MSSNLVKGTAILTVGLFLSKALGLLYLIPLYAIVGEENIGHYINMRICLIILR